MVSEKEGTTAKRAVPVWAGGALGFILIVLLAGGGWFFRSQQQRLRAEAERSLETIAGLKVGQIVHWRSERLADASEIMEARFFKEVIVGWFSDPRPEAEDAVRGRFRSLAALRGYFDVLLVDDRGRVRMSLTNRTGSLDGEAVRILEAAVAERRPLLGDLHVVEDELPPHVDVVAPLFPGNEPGARAIGAVFMQSDARRFLYPLIQAWPVPSRSAETLLVRREGDEVVFLNDARHQPGTALKLRIGIDRRDVPAVQAVLGREGVVEGIDYRDARILASLRAVPDSPWFMVAKVDKSEALSGWLLRSTLIVALILAFAAAAGASFLFLWQRSAKVHYQALYRAEAALREREEMMRSIFRVAPTGIGVVKDRVLLEVNTRICEMTGFAPEELVGRNARILYPTQEDYDYVGTEKYRQIAATGTGVVETRWKRKDGAVIDILLASTPIDPRDPGRGITFTALDITERKRAEERLRLTLQEREVMLREIHHRVKNNIQIISSLLRLQSRAIRDRTAVDALNECQSRIRSIALIHEKLYQSRDFARVDFSDYIANMVGHLVSFHSGVGGRVRFRIEADDVKLDINRAIPCGLIINELVTNALKHAFPAGRGGEIVIRLWTLEGGRHALSVKDTGVGLPDGLNPESASSLGFQIVGDLVRQLEGAMEVVRGGGTEIVVRF
ncbi:MAG: PAS domain S-box protein [Candidatus Aminicenantes bacterium]|nr:PAS domain S-box protein [Candidatus Aminicenantes bacterium]